MQPETSASGAARSNNNARAEGPGTTSRSYVFTLNNPDVPPSGWVFKEPTKLVRYAVWQLEKGESGTLHVQGYVELNKSIRYTKLASVFPFLSRARFAKRRGTPEQAREYCMKPETHVEGPWEYGTWNVTQGHRTDLAEVKKKLDTGVSMYDLAQDHFVEFVRYNRSLTVYSEMVANKTQPLVRLEGQIPNPWGFNLTIYPPVIKKRHYWLYSSEPNTGKTTFLEKLNDMAPCYFFCVEEKYQTVKELVQFVLFDEYSRPILKGTELNSICDGNFNYIVKGSKPIKLKKPTIIVCGNKSLAQVYPQFQVYLRERFNEMEVHANFQTLVTAAERVRTEPVAPAVCMQHEVPEALRALFPKPKPSTPEPNFAQPPPCAPSTSGIHKRKSTNLNWIPPRKAPRIEVPDSPEASDEDEEDDTPPTPFHIPNSQWDPKDVIDVDASDSELSDVVPASPEGSTQSTNLTTTTLTTLSDNSCSDESDYEFDLNSQSQQ